VAAAIAAALPACTIRLSSWWPGACCRPARRR